MTLEKLCISFDLAKMLKELECEKRSLYYYYETAKEFELIIMDEDLFREEIDMSEFIAAYTAGELGEMLSCCINDWNLIIAKYCQEYEVKYCNVGDTKRLAVEWDKNMANCMAKMLIHLIENGHVNAEDL